MSSSNENTNNNTNDLVTTASSTSAGSTSTSTSDTSNGNTTTGTKPSTTTTGGEKIVNSSTTISDEMSKRICTHMNDDHKISIYCMAVHATTMNNICTGTSTTSSMKQIKNNLLSYTNKVSSIDVLLKTVTMNNCTIQVVTCSEDTSCTMDTIIYPFIPPLQTSAEIRKRMVQIHHTVVRPFHFINVLSLPVLLLTIIQLVLFYLTYVLSYEQRYNIVQKLIQSLSSSTSTVLNVDTIINYIPKITKLLLILHFIEADIVVLFGKIKLKLKYDALIQWFIVTLFYGIFISIPFFYHIVYRNNYYKTTSKNINKNH